jgi:membrane protease YdiL (CAAX protease family)
MTSPTPSEPRTGSQLYHDGPLPPALGIKLTLLGMVAIYIVQIVFRATGVLALVGSALSDVVVIGGLLLLVRGRAAQAGAFGLRRGAPVFTLAAVLIGIAAWYVNLSFVNLLQVPENERARNAIEELVTQTPLPLTVFAIAMLPALAEELVFRGVLARSLATRLHPAAAIAISSAVFAIYHLQLAQMVTTFVLGLWLGFLTLRARSVVPAMIAHLLNNSIAILISRNELPTTITWMNDHPAPVLVGALVCVVGGLALAALGTAKGTP